MSEEASEHERERERERESERASVQVRESEGGREVEKNDRYNVKVSLPWKCVCFPDLFFCMQVCFGLFGRRDRGTYEEHRFEDKVELAQHICKGKKIPTTKTLKRRKNMSTSSKRCAGLFSVKRIRLYWTRKALRVPQRP